MTSEVRGIRSREHLVQAIEAGQRFKYLFFWGHQPAPGGRITQAGLSQWFAAPFEAGGRLYPTAEHYMMAKKAELFGEHELAAQILAAASPGQAKALGRTVSGFDERVWQQQRREIVVRGNLHKFSQHPALRSYLLDSGSRVLVEASPLDTIWGIGLEAASPAASNPDEWRGLNLLGFALMEVREALAGGASGL